MASGRVFNVIMRAATGLPFRDTQCGFKLFRKDAARVIFPRQRLEGFGFDVEDLLIARIHGFKVVEVPVRWDNVEGHQGQRADRRARVLGSGRGALEPAVRALSVMS